MMEFKVKEDIWTFKLALQLTGKSRQAFAAMDKSKTNDYKVVKKRYTTSTRRLTTNVFGQ